MNISRKLSLVLIIVSLFSACSAAVENEPVVENAVEVNGATAEGAAIVLEMNEEADVEVGAEEDVSEAGEEVAVPELEGTLSNSLSPDEQNSLLFMREEEKLAEDVYRFFYDLWGSQIFSNIASSEATHTEAVRTLIVQYGLEDPAVGAVPGEFANPDLQQLYDDLVELGSQSLADALKVGAAIEEIDILDLEDYLVQTENPDILRVYQNLLKGSKNHLRAFVGNIERKAAENYAPQYMSQEAFDAIVN